MNKWALRSSLLEGEVWVWYWCLVQGESLPSGDLWVWYWCLVQGESLPSGDLWGWTFAGGWEAVHSLWRAGPGVIAAMI